MAVAACAALAVSVAACSSDRDTTNLGPTTVPGTTIAVSTTVEATTTLAPTTTVPATTTTPAPATTAAPTTTEAPTTTTELLGASLPLRFDGVGDARFGTEPDDVLAYISDRLGDPTADSGWLPANQMGCQGTESRVVFWNDLRVTFGDESNVSTGRRHFFAWRLGPPAGTALNPAGMKTLLGLSVGSTVEQIQAAYPAAQFFAGDANTTPAAQLSEGLFVFLTDASRLGVVTAVLGGEGCSE